MPILSIEFLVFSALMILVYYILPLKIRPWSLLAFSAAFVALSGWQGAVYLLAVSVYTWLGALGLQGRQRSITPQSKEPAVKPGRLLLFFLLAAELGAMLFLKYRQNLADWIAGGWLNKFLSPVFGPVVPLGLSYFTFQSMGYLIDVFRGKAEVPKNPLRVLLFISYFLYLPQGPISSWRELGPSLNRGNLLDPFQFKSGFQLMVWGFFKKLVIADRLALVTAYVLAARPKMPGWLAMGGTVCYAVRLYADFSGGVDIIRGISRMVGVELPENFRRPFFAASVADYWRRWHITLGAWFRSCLLYPLAAGRPGVWLGKAAGKLFGTKTGRRIPAALATVLVFLLIGIWHAATLNAVYFGLYFGVLMALSLLLDPLWKWLDKKLRLPEGGWMAPLRILRTWVLILLPQFFAYTPTVDKAFSLMGRAFSFSDWDFSTFSAHCRIIMPELEWCILGAAFLLLLIVDLLSERKKDLSGRLARTPLYVRWPLILLLIMAVLVFGCYGTDFEAADFVYTQF